MSSILQELEKEISNVTTSVEKSNVGTVRTVGDGVAIVEGLSETLDLVLTDVVMPDVNGIDAYNRIREILPEIKVLFMSGYAGSEYLTHDILNTSAGFIQKPFNPEELLKRIRGALDQRMAA